MSDLLTGDKALFQLYDVLLAKLRADEIADYFGISVFL